VLLAGYTASTGLFPALSVGFTYRNPRAFPVQQRGGDVMFFDSG
jgi:hypothetical protein